MEGRDSIRLGSSKKVHEFASNPLDGGETLFFQRFLSHDQKYASPVIFYMLSDISQRSAKTRR